MSKAQVLLICFIVFIGGYGAAILQDNGLMQRAFYIQASVTPEAARYLLLYSIQYTAYLFAISGSLGLIVDDRPIRVLVAATQRLSYRVPLMPSTVGVLMLAIGLNWDLLGSSVVMRFGGSELVGRILLGLSCTIIGLAAVRSGVMALFCVALGIVSGFLYPAAISSRAAALPFLFAALCYSAQRRAVLSCIMFLLGVTALWTAFATRANPSLGYYISEWRASFQELAAPHFWKVLLQLSVPGADTTEVAMAHVGEQPSRPLEFLMYISPIPSEWLWFETGRYQSLSGVLGFSGLGINADIFAEPLLWFGTGAVAIGPIVLAVLTCAPFFVLKRLELLASPLWRLAAFGSVLYMLGGGMVFSMRAGTRLLWMMVVLAAVFAWFGRRRTYGSGDARNRLAGCCHDGRARTRRSRDY